jgi:hypothetical protein
VVLTVDIYIISSVLLGSLLIFAGKEITYIDALFFAGGACTGAGLNPVDINKLNTWQQAISPFLEWKFEREPRILMVVLYLSVVFDVSCYFDQYGDCGCQIVLVQ